MKCCSWIKQHAAQGLRMSISVLNKCCTKRAQPPCCVLFKQPLSFTVSQNFPDQTNTTPDAQVFTTLSQLVFTVSAASSVVNISFNGSLRITDFTNPNSNVYYQILLVSAAIPGLAVIDPVGSRETATVITGLRNAIAVSLNGTLLPGTYIARLQVGTISSVSAVTVAGTMSAAIFSAI